jgi:thioredoxin reductase (NADPH)
VLQDDLQKYIDEGKVTVHLETAPTEIIADESGKVTTVKATKAGEATEFAINGVFVFIGLKPNTQFLAGSGVELDEQRLIVTDQHLATNLPGVYASGDVRSGATMQVASAVGEGATAALSIREYLDGMK